MTRSFGGSLSWVYYESGKWSAPRNLGGTLAAVPSCVVRGPGGINCYATSPKGVLAGINLNGKTWSKWESLGGNLSPSRVACVTPSRDRMACYARGLQGQLFLRKWDGGKSWEPWQNLGGALTSDPECLAVDDAHAACFGRGTNSELIAFRPDAVGKAGGWSTLGGRIEGKPSCVRLPTGDVACISKSLASRLQLWRGTAQLTSGAGILSSVDQDIAGEPSCALQSGHLICVMRNQKRQLICRSLAFGAGTSREGVIASPQIAAVSCLSLSERKLVCVATDINRSLQFTAFEKGASVEASVPTEVNVLDMPASQVNVGAREPDGIWYLSNLASRTSCRVVLFKHPARHRKPLRLGPRCPSVTSFTQVVVWEHDRDGMRFLGPDGKIWVRFRAADEGRWIGQKSDSMLVLSRGQLELGLRSRLSPVSDPRSSSEAYIKLGDRRRLVVARVDDGRAGEMARARHKQGIVASLTKRDGAPTVKRFSFTGRLDSLRYALSGLRVLLTTQHNARIHLTATIAVVVAGYVVGLAMLEWASLTIAISIVWLAEALNTGFEFVCDVVSPEFHPKVKQAKDVAAGGVLIAAAGAAGTGAFIFAPHIL